MGIREWKIRNENAFVTGRGGGGVASCKNENLGSC